MMKLFVYGHGSKNKWRCGAAGGHSEVPGISTGVYGHNLGTGRAPSDKTSNQQRQEERNEEVKVGEPAETTADSFNGLQVLRARRRLAVFEGTGLGPMVKTMGKAHEEQAMLTKIAGDRECAVMRRGLVGFGRVGDLGIGQMALDLGWVMMIAPVWMPSGALTWHGACGSACTVAVWWQQLREGLQMLVDGDRCQPRDRWVSLVGCGAVVGGGSRLAGRGGCCLRWDAAENA
ncbi:hypothetical protein GALMADRAFT_206509 [Galerina marginata CBS 339.88]|uniref:Uncharacterized protein n=1 Tax=Galerina marginata (strain CBS 339.88) TaxID=685588 RepID=A0A067THT7_GALM3|nr:hypothetical protein GALMADRAFT_206509 [Galerina marginata CBS 339.88]